MFKKELFQIQSVVVSNLKYFVLLIFSIISVGIIEYTFPYVYRLVVDEVLVRKSLEQMPRFVLAYVVLVTLLVGLATLRSFARSTLSVHSTKHVRKQLLRKLESHVAANVQQEANSEALQLALNDTTEYRNYWAVFQDAVGGVSKACIGFILLISQSIPLTVFVLFYTIFALFIPWWLNKKVEKSSRVYFHIWGQVTKKLENLIMGIGQMLQMGVYKKQFTNYENTFNQAIRDAQQLSVRSTLSGQSFIFFNFLLTPFSFMFLLPQLQNGTISTGAAIALTMYASSFIGNINTLVDAWSQRSQLSGAFDRIHSFLAREVETPPSPSVVFLPKRGLTVFIGPTGVGKTTLISALFNFNKHEDTRYLHQRLEFPDWTLQEVLELSEVKAIISQELLGLLNVTDTSLPLSKLSGGEKQLVSLALVLASSSQLVYLDESFSAMNDALAEKVICIIKIHRQNLMTVVVAHQPIVQNFADQVITLKRDSGNHLRVIEAI